MLIRLKMYGQRGRDGVDFKLNQKNKKTGYPCSAPYSPKCRSVIFCLRFFATLSILVLSGCSQKTSSPPATGTSTPSNPSQPAVTGATGAVYGRQLPVSGAAIQLYAVGTTSDGSAATPLLTQAVTSDTYGGFSLAVQYSCPSPAIPVYVTVTGGSPSLSNGTKNPAIALMAALGPCGALNASTFVTVNELTTVASIFALAPYMSSLRPCRLRV